MFTVSFTKNKWFLHHFIFRTFSFLFCHTLNCIHQKSSCRLKGLTWVTLHKIMRLTFPWQSSAASDADNGTSGHSELACDPRGWGRSSLLLALSLHRLGSQPLKQLSHSCGVCNHKQDKQLKRCGWIVKEQLEVLKSPNHEKYVTLYW